MGFHLRCTAVPVLRNTHPQLGPRARSCQGNPNCKGCSVVKRAPPCTQAPQKEVNYEFTPLPHPPSLHVVIWATKNCNTSGLRKKFRPSGKFTAKIRSCGTPGGHIGHHMSPLVSILDTRGDEGAAITGYLQLGAQHCKDTESVH